MRRNMEIVRELLIKISIGTENLSYDPTTPEGKLYIYHIEIIEQAGFIKYERLFEDMIPMVYVDEVRLTWSGNDYLDAVKNDNIWKKIKEVIKAKGLELGDVPFSVIIELGKKQVKDLVGLE